MDLDRVRQGLEQIPVLPSVRRGRLCRLDKGSTPWVDHRIRIRSTLARPEHDGQPSARVSMTRPRMRAQGRVQVSDEIQAIDAIMSFPTTHWSLLAQATSSGDAEARGALEELCRRYWVPTNRFIRVRGYRELVADDLTQEFFLHVCRHSTFSRAERVRGRFRTFLLGALVKFLANESDRAQAQKRGGGIVNLRWDDIEDSTIPSVAPESSVGFDREWAITILGNVMTRVCSEYSNSGRQGLFGVLKEYLPGSAIPPRLEEAANRLGSSVAAVKSEVHRLRLRFRALIREEVASTVSAPHEIEEEMAHLQRVLMDRRNHL